MENGIQEFNLEERLEQFRRLFVDTTPVMRADDEERSQKFEISAEQKKALSVMIIIQAVMIVVNFALFGLQITTFLKFGVGSIATIIIFMVIYLNFLKLANFLADCGIKKAFITLVKIVSPILYFLSFILCITTMV